MLQKYYKVVKGGSYMFYKDVNSMVLEVLPDCYFMPEIG